MLLNTTDCEPSSVTILSLFVTIIHTCCRMKITVIVVSQWGRSSAEAVCSLTVCFLCCGSSANSCRGSHRVFVAQPLICIYLCEWVSVFVCVCVGSHCLFLHLPAGPWSISWLQVLQWAHFLPSATAVFAYPWSPAISCQRGRGNYRKQDEHPGQEGSVRAGRRGRRRSTILEMAKRTIDTYQRFFSAQRVDIGGVFENTGLRLTTFLHRHCRAGFCCH